MLDLNYRQKVKDKISSFFCELNGIVLYTLVTTSYLTRSTIYQVVILELRLTMIGVLETHKTIHIKVIKLTLAVYEIEDSSFQSPPNNKLTPNLKF